MKATEYEQAWDGWSAIKQLNLGRRTGRFAAFYQGHHHLFLDLSGGIIAGIEVSDRRLKVEQVLLRQGVISSDDVRRAFHTLETMDRITPLSHVLLADGVISGLHLAAARQQQMGEALRAVLASERETMMFIPRPVSVQKVETIIRIDDALASAFATFGLEFFDITSGSGQTATDRIAMIQVLPSGRTYAASRAEPQFALSRHAR